MLLCRTGPDHFDEYSLEASEGGFFDFSWGVVSSSISNACTTIANVTCDIGFGMCNGFFSPVDTTGEWIGGGGETPTASTATRVGEVCGVVAAGASVYSGIGVAVTVGKLAAKQACYQCVRLIGKQALTKSGKSVATVAVGEVSALTVAEGGAAVAAVEAKVTGEVVKDGIRFSKQDVNSKVLNLEREISNWLGSNTKMIKKTSGDRLFVSNNGAKRVRFDLKHPAPHSNSHGHIEEFINGTWNKSGPIYPIDIPHY